MPIRIRKLPWPQASLDLDSFLVGQRKKALSTIYDSWDEASIAKIRNQTYPDDKAAASRVFDYLRKAKGEFILDLGIQDFEIRSLLFINFPLHAMETEGSILPFFFAVNTRIPIQVLNRDARGSRLFEVSSDGALKELTKDQLRSPEVAIGRGDAFLWTAKDRFVRQRLRGSSVRINVKPMAVRRFKESADVSFREEEFCPLPYLRYQQNLASTREISKQPFFIVHGRVYPIKNQLSLIANFPLEFRDHAIIFVGPIRADRYLKACVKMAEQRGIEAYFVGHVDRETNWRLTKSASLSLIPMDMTINNQMEGYPRVMGESIGLGTGVVANLPVTIPKFLQEIVISTDFNSESDLSSAISLALSKTVRPMQPRAYVEQLVEFAERILLASRYAREAHEGA